MFADQIFQPIDRFRLGDIEFHRRFADLEIHFARRTADVAKIRVRHFARAVHNAPHDRNLYSLEMRRRCLDFRRRGLQIKQCSSARRAGHVISFENPRTGRLKGIVA